MALDRLLACVGITDYQQPGLSPDNCMYAALWGFSLYDDVDREWVNAILGTPVDTLRERMVILRLMGDRRSNGHRVDPLMTYLALGTEL